MTSLVMHFKPDVQDHMERNSSVVRSSTSQIVVNDPLANTLYNAFLNNGRILEVSLYPKNCQAFTIEGGHGSVQKVDPSFTLHVSIHSSGLLTFTLPLEQFLTGFPDMVLPSRRRRRHLHAGDELVGILEKGVTAVDLWLRRNLSLKGGDCGMRYL